MGRNFYHDKNKNNKRLPSVELEIVDVAFGGTGSGSKRWQSLFRIWWTARRSCYLPVGKSKKKLLGGICKRVLRVE